MKKLTTAEQIFNQYLHLRNQGTHIDFENYRFMIWEKYDIDDSDWDKTFMWSENPKKEILKSIKSQLNN